jgi:hypothetical protein
MAISLAAGVAFATMITLVLIPSLYVIRATIVNSIRVNSDAIRLKIYK